MILKLVRAYLDNCCIGKVYYKGEFICYTIEKPWKNNAQRISCIPAGLYKIEDFTSIKHPNCYLLRNEMLGVGDNTQFLQRYNCLIHPANYPCDIEGCIGPGLSLQPKVWGVKDSRKAMTRLRSLIHTNNIKEIEIT